MNNPQSLARQNALLLAGAFILVELLTLVLSVSFVLLPLARRSAQDLAGLMVLSAQTWAELPPQTRKVFEAELLSSHTLALRPALALEERKEWHPPFFYFLEDALAQRTGTHHHMHTNKVDDAVWYWANLPAGMGYLAVGVPQSRIDSQPGFALLVTLLGGLLLAVGFAFWLARRITAPLAQLANATALIGKGENPVLLPETGPLELVTLSRRFNAMGRQVRNLLTARTTLLAGVSHDLRTPLARLRLALELLKLDPKSDLIERMERDIEQMDRLIGNVLDLARGLEREPALKTDLPDFLIDLAEDFSTSTGRVSVTCPPGQSVIPRVALHRALGNLLQNALRYAPEAPIELVCEMNTDHCRFGVLDRGPGIPSDQIEAMFQPFHRLDASRSPVTGGSGLGLAIVGELAAANGWQVTMLPRPGGGMQAWLVIGCGTSSGTLRT